MRLDELARVLYQTDRAGLKRFLRGVLNVHWTEQTPIPLDAHLRILLEDWMTHLGFLTDAQRFEINRAVHIQVEAHADALAEQKTPLPVFRLVIGDYRWVSCDGRDGFFDLNELDEVAELPHEAVTYIVCDLTALYLRSQQRLSTLRHTHRMPNEPGNPENSRGNSVDCS